MRRGARLCAAILCAGLVASGLRAGPETLRLSLPEARGAAAQLLTMGRPAEALTLADGVLTGAPGDAPALILRSRALRDMGRNSDAVASARRAWGAAEQERDRFFAALAMAQARASNDQRAIAQFWLRRAAQIAPDDGLRAVAVRDFRHVRRSTPWRVRLDLSAAPSDNVNGAPKSNAFYLGSLRLVNPAAIPLSGTRVGAAADLRYTLPLAPHARLHLDLGAAMERVRLSDAARATLPGVEARDFREDALHAGLSFERMGPERRWISEAALQFGRDWRAGEAHRDFARMTLGHRRAVGRGFEIGGTLAFETERSHALSLRDARTRALTLTGLHILDGGARLRLDLTGSRTISESAAVAREGRAARLAFGLGRPVLGAVPQLALHWERLDFDRPLYGPDPRQDHVRRASLSVLLPDLDYMGFAPEIGVSFTRTRSNYSLFTSESTDLRLGLRSVF